MNKVTCVDEQAKKEMLSKLFQSAPQTISEPFALQVMMRRKDGRVFQCTCRHQAFYNELGYVSPPPNLNRFRSFVSHAHCADSVVRDRGGLLH